MRTTNPLDALTVFAGAGLVLSILAFIAAIVVTVLLYQKFVSEGKSSKTPEGKRDWGPFFRFESLIIEKILKALYIFTTCLIAFEAIAVVISFLIGAAYNPIAALTGIFVVLILGAFFEVLNRLGFEFTMLTILIWKNTSDIRKSIKKNGFTAESISSDSPASPASSASASTTEAANAAKTEQPSATSSDTVPMPAVTEKSAKEAEAKAQPSDTSSSENDSWTCSSCGTTNKAGSFCSQCGTKRN